MKKAVKKAAMKPTKQISNLEKVQLTHFKKMFTEMFGFIYQLRQDEITNAAYFYLTHKDPSDGSFNKKQRSEFYKWLAEENDNVKERWTKLANTIYSDKALAKKFIDELFKKSDITNITKVVEKSMNKFDKRKSK